MNVRRGGILLHVTSLPGKYGIGDFGPEAYRFVDFLRETKTGYWQILPLNPTELGLGNSPYSSTSAFALNPLLISPELLVAEKLLNQEDIEDHPAFREGLAEYGKTIPWKISLLYKAYENNIESLYTTEFEQFCNQNEFWLDDFSLFSCAKMKFNGKIWKDWPGEIRFRNPEHLSMLKDQMKHEIGREKFIQWIAHKQWFALKSYANDKGIQLIGDIPIYVHYDSADVWSNGHLFKLNDELVPHVVAGVPPDYFSETGQLWGNPVYKWEELEKQDFLWWIKRVEKNFELYNIARIDHFRGLVAYWEVPAEETTAINGKWVNVPKERFFESLERHFTYLPFIAEDLGMITPDVTEFLNRTGYPGMRVLQFGFMSGEPGDKYLPHNYIGNCVAYTGTHDNNTLVGWYKKEINREQKKFLCSYFGRKIRKSNVNLEMIRLGLMSNARAFIFPMQDLLGLDHRARMNKPASTDGNWLWRLKPGYGKNKNVLKLKEMNEIYGRV